MLWVCCFDLLLLLYNELTFLHNKMLHTYCIYLAQTWNQPFYQGALIHFIGKVGKFGCYVRQFDTMPLGSLRLQSKIHLYMLIHAYLHIYKYPYMLSAVIVVNILISPTLSHNHMYCSSLFLLLLCNSPL